MQETCWAGLRYPAAAGEYAGVRLHVGSTSVLVFREDEFFTCACFSTCVTARPAGILGGWLGVELARGSVRSPSVTVIVPVWVRVTKILFAYCSFVCNGILLLLVVKDSV